MNSAQEAKQELQAAIRYCENAISAANSTIESLDFRHELAKQQTMSKKESTGREERLESALNDANSIISEMRKREKALQNKVGELKDECAALEREVSRIKDINKERQAMIDEAKEDRAALIKQVEELKNEVAELEQSEQDLKQANLSLVCDNDDLKDELFKLREDKERLTSLEVQLRDKIRELEDGKAIMPVIPRDVAIAIFREGIKQGVSDACDALSDEYVQVDVTESFGDFEVSFQRDIKLGDDLDLDWIRDKVGSYDKESVTDNLKGLLENLNFKNRIDGIDKV